MASASFLERYEGGEHIEVWKELTDLGDQAVVGPLASDVNSVATAMMVRVKYNAELLAARLPETGYRFGWSWATREGVMSEDEAREMEAREPVLSTVPGDIDLLIDTLEQRFGTLPISLRQFYAVIGGINFVGYNDDWPFHRLDPLGVLSPQTLLYYDSLIQWSQDIKQNGTKELPISPDEYGKYRISGGPPYSIAVPVIGADAEVLNEWHGTTFVSYLRECFYWAGLPGWKREADAPRQLLERLREELLPF